MKIEDMPAGREMDALVAEKVMGFPMMEKYPTDDLKEYSTDIAAAWEVMEKLMPMFGGGRFCLMRSRHSEDWQICERDGVEYFEYARAEEAPLAICRAALKVLGGVE